MNMPAGQTAPQLRVSEKGGLQWRGLRDMGRDCLVLSGPEVPVWGMGKLEQLT